MPRWTYAGLQGDATGFYAASREFIAAWGRVPRPLLALVAIAAIAAAVAIVLAWRRRPDLRPWLVPLALFAFGLVICVDIHWQELQRRRGLRLAARLGAGDARPTARSASASPTTSAGGSASSLSLVFVALTVVAVGYLGRYASGRRWVGLLAAGFWTFWPLLVGLIAGHHAWANNQWDVDVGLHLYDEPLSTLLVTGGAALLLSPRLTPMRLSLAGCALSVATATKVSNALLAAAALVIVFLRGRKVDALPFLAGALAFAPVVLVYWPMSYPKLFEEPALVAADPFDPAHIVIELDALVDLHAAHARDRRAARRRRRVGRAPPVGARARARLPPDQPGLLQLLREHGPASALPLREPAGAVRALGGRHRRSRRVALASGGGAAERGAVSVGKPVVLIAIAGAALGVGLRIWVLRSHLGAVDSDEAVVGLLAKGILHGRLPVFFPGQGYGGTQEEFLAAPLIALFGLSATTIRAAPIALWASSAILVWLHRPPRPGRAAGCAGSGRVLGLAAYFVWKSTRAHGFYGSELVLGLVVLLLVLRLARKRSVSGSGPARSRAGCGLWSSPQVAIVALPALGWLVWHDGRSCATRRSSSPRSRRRAAVAGRQPPPRLVLAPSRRERGPWTNHVHNLVVSTLPEALGLRLAWSYEWLGGVIVGVIVYSRSPPGFVWLLIRQAVAPHAAPAHRPDVFPVFYFVSPYTWLESEPRYLTLVMPIFALLIASAMTTAIA